jgi:hypothetical protein
MSFSGGEGHWNHPIFKLYALNSLLFAVLMLAKTSPRFCVSVVASSTVSRVVLSLNRFHCHLASRLANRTTVKCFWQRCHKPIEGTHDRHLRPFVVVSLGLDPEKDYQR